MSQSSEDLIVVFKQIKEQFTSMHLECKEVRLSNKYSLNDDSKV
jgi:hypothetical protein